jgi:hypothetical protein
MVDFCEHGNMPFGSLEGGEFLDYSSRRTMLHGVIMLLTL